MADRFPLIVNATSKKIEEIASGDRLDLSGNGFVIGGDGGSGKYLKSNGTQVLWDIPGDVYLTQTQTITNKTFETCTISGTNNTLTNIPNTALVNSGITVNGVTIALGGTVTTPDNNTIYSISVVDGLAATEKIIRLTSGGNSGAGVTDDVSLVAGSNVTLSRTGDAITINSSYVDTNTVTRLKSSVGGVFQDGDVTIAATGSSTVSQDPATKTITINSTYVDTITKLRVSNSGTLASGDFTFVQGGATTITDSGTGTFTISSTDTITRLKASGAVGFIAAGDFTIAAAGASIVSQDIPSKTITITSTDTNTVTRVRGTNSGTYATGDITILASGSTTVSPAPDGSTITISSTDTNTTYTAGSAGGLALTGTQFGLKNVGNLVGSKVIKWDAANNQITNSIIEDNGSTVTIAGDLTVTGVTTTIDTANLRVADNEIELRRGIGLLGSNGGIRLNRTTDGSGAVQTWAALQWFESGGYWRTLDNGGVAHRFVTEGEVQTLTNKTLTSPTLTAPVLGIASATTINGVTITNAASATLTIANNKTFTCNNTLTFTGTDSSSVAFGNGGTVAYTANTLSVFASTSSTQLRGIISDETGIGSLVFNTNPVFSGSIGTTDTSIAVFNTAATGVNAFGVATQIIMGATSGTTQIRNSVLLDKAVTLGSVAGDAITVNGTPTFNTDIEIRGIDVGRGGNNILGNMRIGQDALFSNTTGSQNTAVGYEAGYTINSGAGNVVVGYDALHDLSTGQYNVALGRSAVTNMLTGGKNIGIGANTLEANTTGNGNVCIGHYAGAGATGTGNVLIGPADDENITNATYRPPNPTGNRQLVIGSGTGTWMRGDSAFSVYFPQSVDINGSVTIGGNLTVSGTTTTINSTVIKVDDKAIELGDVQSVSFTATVTNNSSTITSVSATSNLIPGMVVTISTAGITVPAGTQISTISGNQITLTNNVSGNSGTATFNAVGPSDTSADGGGIILKGTTDKTLLWDDADDAWTSSEHMDLASGKAYKINGTNVLTATALGAGVSGSSLTTVGNLLSLTVVGDLTVDTNTLYVDSTNNRVHIGQAGTALANLNITGTGGQGGGIQINRNTSGSPTSGQSLGSIAFKGVNSANSNAAGEVLIEAIASENHSGSTAGTELAIYTKPSGTGPGSSPTKRVTITSAGILTVSNKVRCGSNSTYYAEIDHDASSTGANIYNSIDTGGHIFQRNGNEQLRIDGAGNVSIANGNLVIGTSGKGIDFSANANAAGMTSELLDDYERGTFTPTLANAGTPTYTNQLGEYVKIGSSVFINVLISYTGATPGANTRLSGLPFAMTDSAVKVVGWATQNNTGSTVYLVGTTGLSTTQLYVLPLTTQASYGFSATIQITTL
jgi:hypothetical protein